MKGKKLAKLLALYLDDILILMAGVCFVSAAGVQFGGVAAITVAGAWMALLAFLIARAKGGGGK